MYAIHRHISHPLAVSLQPSARATHYTFVELFKEDPIRKAHHHCTSEGDKMEELVSTGPIDYIVVEWTREQPDGSAMPLLIDLVDRGVIRLLDLVFIHKEPSGTYAILEVDALNDSFAVFTGARSGLLGDDDITEAAKALAPNTSAAVLVYENSWAAPFATALRQNGAEMVASGRIPVSTIVAAIESESD
jgi:hypothetical protein